MNPLKLKIELIQLPHEVTRKVLVPEDINMHQLHLIIQESIGWTNSHLFEFYDHTSKNTIRAGIPDELDEEVGLSPYGPPKLRDAHQVFLKSDFEIDHGAKPFYYEYDFGDSWIHRISFQKVSKKDISFFSGKPICLSAQGNCPPEDIGGIPGYFRFLEVIKDKSHPEYEEMAEWMGIDSETEYDENHVNLADINEGLSFIYKSKEWNSTTYDDFFF